MGSKIHRTFLLAILMLVSTGAMAEHRVSGNKAELNLVKRAVHCLLSDAYVRNSVLKYVGYRVGDAALVGIHEGSVVDPADKTGVYDVILFSKDDRKSVLLMLDASDKRQLKSIPNGYLLRKGGDGWSVDEGEGGYVDYATVASFVTQFKKEDIYSVSLSVNAAECQSAE
jgi:hypothetical protein